jgi:hypothetical protein
MAELVDAALLLVGVVCAHALLVLAPNYLTHIPSLE